MARTRGGRRCTVKAQATASATGTEGEPSTFPAAPSAPVVPSVPTMTDSLDNSLHSLSLGNVSCSLVARIVWASTMFRLMRFLSALALQ